MIIMYFFNKSDFFTILSDLTHQVGVSKALDMVLVFDDILDIKGMVNS